MVQGQSASKSLVPYKGNLFNATTSDDDGSDDDDDGAESASVAPEDEDEEHVCGGCPFSFSPSAVAAATAEGTALDATKRTKRAK